MSRQIKNGTTETVVFKQMNIKALSLTGLIFGKTNNTALGYSEGFDPQKIDIDIELNQRGKKTTIYKGELLPLLLIQAFFEKEWDKLHPINSNLKRTVQTVKYDTSIKEEAVQPMFIELGGVINLDGSDTLTVEVKVSSDALKTTADANTSYLLCEAIEGIGLQYMTPQYEATVISAQQNIFKEELGDDITSIAFINLDRVSDQKEDVVLKSFDLESDRLSLKDDSNIMFAKRHRSFEEGTDVSIRRQSYMLHFNQEIDKVHVRLDMDSTKVANGKNYLVVQRFKTDGKTIQKAQVKAEKHARKFERKVKN